LTAVAQKRMCLSSLIYDSKREARGINPLSSQPTVWLSPFDNSIFFTQIPSHPHFSVYDSQSQVKLQIIYLTLEAWLANKIIAKHTVSLIFHGSNSHILLLKSNIWNSKFRVQFEMNKQKKIFLRLEKIARTRRASAVCSLWKIYESVFFLIICLWFVSGHYAAVMPTDRL